MKHDAIKTTILSVQIIPNADAQLCSRYRLPKSHHSLGIITTDCDDVSYAALDEATKKADVKVVYAESMYAGAKNASTALAGEFIGILAATDPDTVTCGLEAAIAYIEQESCFYSANDDDSVVYYAQCISRSGSYLSQQAKVTAGTSLAYLVAPPVEALVGLDDALKAAAVELKVLDKPPTNTNFAGALLSGSQAACQAACESFKEAVCRVANQPRIL